MKIGLRRRPWSGYHRHLHDEVPRPSGQQCGQDMCEIPFCPIGLALRVVILRDSFEEGFDGGAGEGFGERLGQLWPSDQLHRIGGQLLARIEEGAQHISGGPASADRCSFIVTRSSFPE